MTAAPADHAHKGYATKCKKGLFKSSKRFFLVLPNDGVLTFYADKRAHPGDAKKVIQL